MNLKSQSMQDIKVQFYSLKMCLLCAVERRNKSVPGDLWSAPRLGTRCGQRFFNQIKDLNNQNGLHSVLVVFSVASLLPVQLSVLSGYGKQMLEMFVTGRWSGMKPRSNDYRPTGDQRRPREVFCVSLAATGSTVCNGNAIHKTRRMGKKVLPRLGLIRRQRRFSAQRKNSSTVLFSAFKVKQAGIWTNERLSV